VNDMGRLKNRFIQDEEIPYYQPVEEQYDDYVEEEGVAPTEYHQQSSPPQAPQDNSPLAILDEIKKAPSPKGMFPMLIGGRPVDLHAIEDYVVRISPYNIKTILRYHNARTIEEIKGYGRFGGAMKMNGKTILIILLAIGMAIGGIFFIMFLPQIMQSFQAGI